MGRQSNTRKADAVIGVFLLCLVPLVLTVAWEDTPLGAAVVALSVGFLGVDAIVSAVRDRRSLVSRIGPLP